MTTSSQSKSLRDYLQQAEAVFNTIPGMDQVKNATQTSYDSVAAQYPDAVFALMVASNLFSHDTEISHIHQAAFFAICNGERIQNVRFRYDRDMDSYIRRHSWDS